MSVRDIHRAMAALTPQQRALFARRLEESGWSSGVQEILPRPATGAPVVTSLMQQRLWILGEMEPGNPFYNLPLLCFRLTGRPEPRDRLPAALARCFLEIERRHESLRTVFAPGEPFPLQVILPPGERPFPLIDLSALPAERREPAAWELAREEGRQPFDLGAGPLWRTSLLRLASDREAGDHLLLVTMHHIISDAWSLGVFYRELGALYAAFVRGLPSPLPEPQIQYADFALWQREQLQGERLAGEIGFWREQLAGIPDLLELPTDRPRPTPRTFDGERLTTWFSPALADGIAALSARSGASLYMTLLAAFAVILHRWTGQDDIVLGAPVAGRTHVATETLIGFFVNTVAFRVRLGGDPAFQEVVAHTRNTVLDVYEHQELPFDKLVEELNPRRNPAWSPVFQAMISLQNTPTPDLVMPGLRVEMLGINTGTSQTDLIVFAGMERGKLGLLHLEYNTDLFDKVTMQRMEGHLLRLLAGAVADAGQRLSLLPMLSAAEMHQLADLSSAGALPAPASTLHGRFAAQARQRPTAVALSDGSFSLTYAELERRANALAHHLRGLGVEPETRVGLCTERGPEMIIALLGILKAGGAYVPLDPFYPQERLEFLLDDALGGQENPLVLVGEGLLGRLPETGQTGKSPVHTVRLSRDLLKAEADRPPAGSPVADQAAYVIYTSGSTGRPKGVLNTHASVLGFLAGTWSRSGVTAGDVWTQFHSFVFDFSVWEIFGSLLSGGRLVIVPREVARSPRSFLNLLAAEGVTLLNQTPAALYQLAAEPPPAAPLALRAVLSGGETLDLRRLAAWWPTLQGDQSDRIGLFNVYGITETTVLSTARPVGRGEIETGPRIGWPLPGVSLHLLGPRGETVPLGVAGEIHLGGSGLARGYLKRPELTAERFVPDPFAALPGVRLYRSGDLARRLPDGDLEYLGRIDRQVKVRGFRIELGEVEAALVRHPAVRACAADLREVAPGDRGIVAWLVPADPSPSSQPAPEPAELRAFLEASLPAHMIPAVFTPIAALPLMPSGKVDRKALPAPERSGAGGAEKAPPRTPLEASLAELWCELLGLDQAGKVGRDDDFFALGGHSLLATRLTSRLRDRLQVEVPAQLVFQTPRLADLAAALEQVRESGVRPQAPALTAMPRLPRRPRRAV
jgi:amino acid adenylation domain-containing protein